MAASIRRIADELGMDTRLVSDVLKEVPGVTVPKATADRIFSAARRLGYDLKKLKVGKRMELRRETLEEVLNKLGENEEWGRAEIVKYLRDALTTIDRVHKRVYPEEFGR
jgi:DNA-binding LacI/PurR family transcriptional regulator